MCSYVQLSGFKLSATMLLISTMWLKTFIPYFVILPQINLFYPTFLAFAAGLCSFAAVLSVNS